MSERRSKDGRESKGVLFVVATPIGNLEDMTLRAIKTLKRVQLVAAEDTRRTAVLLRYFDINTPILSVHEHNERARVERIIRGLAKGDSVALVTDAGTPGISDPGAAMVAAVRAAGFTVEPIPGASAVAAAISASGITSHGYTFSGFPPIRGRDRKNWFSDASEASKKRLVVFFEAPHRLQKTLAELDNYIKRPIIIGRELTKIHEEFAIGVPGELSRRFESPYGEFTLMIPPESPGEAALDEASEEEVLVLFVQITEIGRASTKREVAREVGERLGLTAKRVYDIVERNKLVE